MAVFWDRRLLTNTVVTLQCRRLPIDDNNLLLYWAYIPGVIPTCNVYNTTKTGAHKTSLFFIEMKMVKPYFPYFVTVNKKKWHVCFYLWLFHTSWTNSPYVFEWCSLTKYNLDLKNSETQGLRMIVSCGSWLSVNVMMKHVDLPC